MEHVRQWIYAHRVHVFVGILLMLSTVIGATSIHKAGDINDRVHNIFRQELIPLETLEDIKSSMYRIRERAGRHITEPLRQEFHEAKIAEQLRRYESGWDQYRESRLDSNEKRLMQAAIDAWGSYINIIQNRVLPLSRKGETEEAEDVLYGEALSNFRSARRSLNALSDYQIHRAERRQYNANNAYLSILKFTFAIIVSSVLLGLIVIIRYRQAHEDNKFRDLILTHNSQGVMMTDKDVRITWVNKAFENITGFASSEVIGKSPSILSSGKQTKGFYVDIWDAIRSKGFWEGEIWNRRKNGDIFPQWLNIVSLTNRFGEVDRYAATFIDLTPLRKAEEKIKQLAYYDSLTGLGNHHLLREKLARQLMSASESDGQVGLLVLDIDHFSQINEGLGRKMGDKVLKSVAELLQMNAPSNGLVTRHDNDRFVIVVPFPGSSWKHLDSLLADTAQHISNLLARAIYCDNQEIRISCSIGVACSPKDATDGCTLLKQASIALNHVKRTNRGRFRFYDAALGEQYNHQYQLALALGKAVQNDELFLVYQPQVDRHGVVVGAEVLLRWKNSEFGVISPDVFIPIAEERGYILEIGRWVFRQALAQLTEWERSGKFDLGGFRRIAINISPHQVLTDNGFNELISICNSMGVSPRRVELEITETSMMSLSDGISSRLDKLRQYGFSIAIDDFGTGYSSLGRLNAFPVSILKVDRSFTREITKDRTQAAIVQYIIRMAHLLGIQVVVEGVEIEAEAEMLVQYGCDIFQGYYYSKPLSGKEFLGFCARSINNPVFSLASRTGVDVRPKLAP